MRSLTCCGLLLVLIAACAQTGSGSQSARDLTVRLFSTAPVAKVTFEPKAASVRLCESSCREIHVSGATTVSQAVGGGMRLQVGSLSARDMRIDGEVRATVPDGRVASVAGRWLVTSAADGLHVTLTLPSERYVMAVLQTEAGQEDGPEALKALAVVARSFALTHPERHGVEGLCDSTHCQAARFAPVPVRIHDAVLATAGETLWVGGKRVDGYFTQNCGGHTADAAEVWGGAPKSWLGAHEDPYCQRQPAQWHASVGKDELLRSLRQEGFRVPPAFSFVRVATRESSGRARELELSAGAQKTTVNAAALRFAVNRALGWNRLRSDWYSVHMDGQNIVFDGRGYGHGVGLCQAGAAEMAREGRRYREILAFYFASAVVRVNANDEGWRTEQKNGWTLRSTKADAEIVRMGDEAWADAFHRWGEASPKRPTVTLSPDTELFRQLTNESGWALAATSGDRVTLQPSAVVKAHGGDRPLLLHEFLHVVVEAEAEESAPLWLREGLVEALAGERSNGPTMTPGQIDDALQHAGDLRQSQAAHHAAGALVRKLIARYGLSGVRRWLRGGVPPGVLASQ